MKIVPYQNNTNVAVDHSKEQELLSLMRKNSSKEARLLLPFEDAQKFGVLPLSILKNETQDILTVATCKKLNKDLIESLRLLTGFNIKDIYVSSSDFEHVIFSTYYSDESIVEKSVNVLSKNLNNDHIEIKKFFEESNNEESKFLEDIIKYAISVQASDLHIIPTQIGTSIKLRVNGNFLELNNLKILKKQHLTLIRRIKILSSLNLDKKDYPQDGSFVIPELKNFGIRVSTMPTIFGEKAVLRFHSYKIMKDISELGISENVIFQMKNFLDSKGGAMLCAGPTSSGKSTTLYAMLNYLKNKGLNVVTLEDPVELILDGVSQTSLNPKMGFDYKDALPAILRQDPDVIMIGEIRDEISAAYLFQSVFSGHKVLSTIHAGNILEIFLRLKSLNINAINMAQAIKFLSYQELLPKMCDKCMIKEQQASDFLKIDVFDSMGCKDCSNTGISGKVLAMETLTLNGEIRQGLLMGNIPSYEDLKKYNKFFSFKEYVYNLLKDKKISCSTFGKNFSNE